ncbi:sigma-54 interaction domain-containing protein [Alkaliphilus peptidifermentans]|uniref:PAS domain S-box-containing protein n=1 Tax=Alkaliphilus peptidifermentans DSM 18978 TaxID=1120976 RepID=A0A1G5AC74_9FIRM|nr:sigma 54-interacting transcriptional regulator [Alkaliphilus peptidifermentans]SCX75475.1 PAS domain S-box-containing protein [Alkaliphilus peptidifermentans DSM 18978]
MTNTNEDLIPKAIGQAELIMDKNTIEWFYKIFDPIPVSMILVDEETNIMMINNEFCRFLEVTKEEAIGKKVEEINPNSRFPLVMKTKKSEIAWKHTFANGHTAIVHRIPILNNEGEVLYGFGMVLFDNMEEFQNIIVKNKLLQTEIKHYKQVLQKIQGAYYSWDNIIGRSRKTAQAKEFGKKASKTGSTVLITGESGTGKELFAHAIHNESRRSHQPFIKVNCGAIPHDLLESELFGYEEGAFTGAKKGGKVGKFEFAEGGSIFLDEIGDMPLKMQVKLLRVLQEKEIERIGAANPIKIDVRIIAATNKNLKELVEKGEFREDLYYRLNVMTIEVPPLRERLEDIEALTKSLLEKLSSKLGIYVDGIDKDALDILKTYSWPGNVRELENVLERAMNLGEEGKILSMHLPGYITKKEAHIKSNVIHRQLSEIIEEVERETIIRYIKDTKGNKLKTAKLLGISRSSLYDKMERYNITV